MTHQPISAQPSAPHSINDEGELNLSRLHRMLFSLAMELKPAQAETRRDMKEMLGVLEAKDPARARLVRSCLRMARSLVNEAADLVSEGIDWAAVEAFYCPPKDEIVPDARLQGVQCTGLSH